MRYLLSLHYKRKHEKSVGAPRVPSRLHSNILFCDRQRHVLNKQEFACRF